MLDDVMTDGVHQVRLSKTDAAVNKERVVRTRRRFGDSAARGVGKLI